MTSPLRREPIREAVRAGWLAALARNSHVRLSHPSGAVVIASGTPGDHRVVRDVRADLRRALRRLEARQ
jgi:predicted RNA binding protein YcfA (HicA-like mRNA interferase family)